MLLLTKKLSRYQSSRHWGESEVAYSSTHTRPRRLRRGVLRATHQPLYPRERDPVPVVQVGPRTRSEWLRKVLPPPRFKSQTVRSVTTMKSRSPIACYGHYKSKYFRVSLWVSLELDQRLSTGVSREAILSEPRNSEFVWWLMMSNPHCRLPYNLLPLAYSLFVHHKSRKRF
jgi:hypothetical protein